MPSQPNVLLFIVDGLRTDTLGCYGCRLPGTSPHLDSFAEHGVIFSQAFGVHSVCMPTRASIHTGRYPHIHGVWANGVPLRRTEVTLPQVLADAGYATCATGKLHFEPQQPYRPLAPAIRQPYYGYQEVHLSENHLGEEYLDFIRERYPDLEQRALKRENMPVEAHDLTWIADQAIDFIGRAAAGARPFLCTCSFHELIPPCTPPPEYQGLYRPEDMTVPELREDDLDRKPPFYRQCYEGYVRNGMHPDEPRLRQHLAGMYDQLRFIDHQFGRLLAALETAGVADKTVVLFTADHGLSLNDHWQWRHGPFLFDEVIHLPQVWRAPGMRAGAAAEALVEQVDIMPTLLELCGVEPPPGVQGVSRVPLLSAADPACGTDGILIQERHAPDFEARGLPATTAWQVGLRTREWKLIHYVGAEWGELYDLSEDPGEFVNLYDDAAYLSIRRELEARLMAKLAEAQDPLPVNDYHY